MELDVEKRKGLASTDSIADPTPVVSTLDRYSLQCDCHVTTGCITQTRQLVAGVLERARLLLSVTIARGHTPSLASYTSTDGDSSSAAGQPHSIIGEAQ